jgi:hypothetical protein
LSILRRRKGNRRRAAAGILGALLLFVMLFTVGTGYFLFVNQASFEYSQALSSRSNSDQGTLAESLFLSTSQGSNGDVDVAVANTGPQAATLEEVFVVSPPPVTVTPLTLSPSSYQIDPGVTTSAIDTSVHYGGGTYSVKVVTQRGSIFSGTYPATATSLASQALTSGAIGDLYLSFSSYTFYAIACSSTNNNCPWQYPIISSNCPSSGSNSGYCLDTNSGYTGPAFAMSVSTYQNDYVGFSVTLTDLSSTQKDIILDQFSLVYQSMFSQWWGDNPPVVPWYIVSTGTGSSGMVPVLNQYTPVVLQYDLPTTVYFVMAKCVTDSYGGNQNHGGCYNANSGSTNPENICSGGYGGNCNDLAGTVSPVFIIASGWELAHGSYNIANLQYSGTNYGQNAPFVSTLYY